MRVSKIINNNVKIIRNFLVFLIQIITLIMIILTYNNVMLILEQLNTAPK